MAIRPTREQVLVSTDWLAEHLDDRGLRIIDCRYYFDRDGREEYLRSHIPGAVHLDWSKELSDPNHQVESMIAPPELVESTMRRLGVGQSTRIVAYDDEGGHFAARVWLVLARYGQADRLRILDGGWTKWLAEGRPVSTEVPAPETGDFTFGSASGHPEIIATLDKVRAAIDDPRTVLLDVRRLSEYTGEEVRARHGGRIPGAVHRFWRDNLDWDGDRSFRGPEAIRALHSESGITPDRPIITYCQGGVRAANAALALWMAGFQDVRVYDGSWAEWGNRDDVPIETGHPAEG